MTTDQQMIDDFIKSGKVKHYPAVDDVHEPADPATLIPTEMWGVNCFGKRHYQHLNRWTLDSQDPSKFDYGK